MTTKNTQDPDVWDQAEAELTKYLVDLIEGVQSMGLNTIPLLDDKNIAKGLISLDSPLDEFLKPGRIKAVLQCAVAWASRNRTRGGESLIVARPQLAPALQYFKTAYLVASPGVRRRLEKSLVDNSARTYH